MRIATIRLDHEQEDARTAKKILRQEIGHPSKTVIIIKGLAPEVAGFVDRVATRTDPFPWRESIWLLVSDEQLEAILTLRQSRWFVDHPEACAVVLDFEDNPSAWLTTEADLLDIETAFLNT